MFRLSNNGGKRFFIASWACMLLCILSGCSIIDLRRLDITTVPGHAGQILAEEEVVSLNFSRSVLETETESLISISTDDGAVDIDFIWEGNNLVLQPVEDLPPATRHYLSVEGRVPLANGAYREADILIPFYYLTDQEKMRLVSVSPARYGTAGGTTSLTFTFSQEPDLSSFSREFTLSPASEYILEKTGTSISVSPADLWEPCTVYEWTLPSAVTSAAGIPLLEAFSGLFLVQEDFFPPRVLHCFPCVYTGSDPVPIAEDLDGINFEGDIALVFSEAVDDASVRAAFSLTPLTEGHLICHSSWIYIFSPLNGWDFQTKYAVSVSTSLKDEKGISAIEPFTLRFMPETISEISVTAVEGVGDSPQNFLLDTLSPQEIDVDELDNSSYTFTIFFSQPYLPDYRTAIEDSLLFDFVFPGGLFPEIRSILWGPGGSSLTVIFEHITWSPPLPGFKNLYRLTLTGGTQTGNGTGGYIVEDLVLVLECDS